MLSAHDRFDAKVHPEPTSGCWLWVGAADVKGYGRLRIGGDWALAHRLSHERFRGPIPDGCEIDHLCRTPSCVNPDHLEAVPSRVNTLRGTGPTAVNARKTHCIHGHQLSGDNLTITGGRRSCRACNREQLRRSRARRTT